MIMRRAITSVLQIFAVFVLFAVGLGMTLLPHLELVRMQLVDLLLNEPEVFIYGGVGFFLGALLLLLGFYGFSRGRYFRIKMGSDIADVKIKLIRESLQSCFKSQFPKRIALEELDLIDNRLEIGVWMKPMETDDKELLFKEAEKALQTLLKERFGYTSSFHMTVRSK